MIRRGHKVPVQATYDWVRLMRRLHDEARLDVWDDRIIHAVLEALEDVVGEAIVEWADSPRMIEYLIRRAGHGKAPVMITNKAIVNLLEIFDTDFAKRKLSKDEMQHIVYSVQTCQSLSTEAMHYGNVVVEEIDDDEGTDYKYGRLNEGGGGE